MNSQIPSCEGSLSSLVKPPLLSFLSLLAALSWLSQRMRTVETPETSSVIKGNQDFLRSSNNI